MAHRPLPLALALLFAVVAAGTAAAPAAPPDHPALAAALSHAPAGEPLRPLARLEAARTLLALGRTAEALLQAETASAEVSLAHPFGDWLEARSGVAALLLAAGESTAAVALLDRLEEDAIRSEDPRVIVAAAARLIEVWTEAGRAGRATRLLDGARRMLTTGGDPNSSASALCMKAKLAARTGDAAGASATLDMVEQVVPAIREDLQYQMSSVSVQIVEAPYLRANHLLIAADIRLDLGDAGRVKALLATVEAELALIRTFDYSDEIHASLARLAARSGDLDEALARLARVGDYELRGATARMVGGRILERDGPAACAAWIAASPRHFSGSPAHLDELRAELALAHARAAAAAAALAELGRIGSPRPLALALARLPAAHRIFATPDESLRRGLATLSARASDEASDRDERKRPRRPTERRRPRP